MAAIIDAIKKAFAPKRERIARRVYNYGSEMRSATGYARHGASSDALPLESWFVFASSPRDDLDKNQATLRKRSRDLYMGSSFYGSILHAKRDGVIGRGLELDAKIDAEALGLDDDRAAEFEHKIEAAFTRFARNVGADGESLNEILQTAYFASILSGDCLALILCDSATRRIRVQIVEGDAVRTPLSEVSNKNIRCGVEINNYGRTQAYHVASEYDNNSDGFVPKFSRWPRFMAGFISATGEWLPPIERGAILIHTPFERPGQLRGLPIASRVLGDMKQLERYMKAELDASVSASKPALFRKHPVIEDLAAVDSFDNFGDGSAAGGPACQDEPLDWGNGLMVDLYDGAEMQAFNPLRPNAAYANFVDHKFSEIAANLGMSAEVALKKWNASYSASRAALLDAQQGFEIERSRFINQFLRPLYNAWLDLHADELGLFGYYDDPEKRSAWRCAEWIGEQLPNIDPTKEIDAAAKRVALCVSTLSREAQIATGADIRAIIRQRGYEERLMRENGLIKDNNGMPLSESGEAVEVDDDTE